MGRFTGGLIISIHLPLSHGPLLLVLKSQLSFGHSTASSPHSPPSPRRSSCLPRIDSSVSPSFMLQQRKD